VARDVSDRLAAEAAVTAAREEAETANRAKTEFLARMSHELRTPLNAIIGFAQLLELDELRPAQKEAVRHVLAAGRHLLDLINEVLDISRIEAGQMRISPEPIALAEAMDEAIAMAAPLARERGIEISIGDMPESWFVLADRQRLVQVLLNLLSNAVKYNRAGGRVMVTADDPDAGRIRVSVADEGPGIDPAMRERLFQPFDRLGAETGAVEGTGLGLSLTKALLAQMGGSLGWAGRAEGGTTFWFELPVPTEERTAAIAAPRTPTSEPPAPAGLGVILHIEDNPSNLRLVERALERRPGVRVIPAMLGRLGQELARQHRPDLILLDLQLPDVAGEVVFARLRADPATSQIPVAILSADASDAHRQRLLDAGARAYLSKPVDLRALFALVDESLGAAGPDRTDEAG
jgi:CheY-like chemotaxis protein/two-component sensor histidine kinase